MKAAYKCGGITWFIADARRQGIYPVFPESNLLTGYFYGRRQWVVRNEAVGKRFADYGCWFIFAGKKEGGKGNGAEDYFQTF